MSKRGEVNGWRCRDCNEITYAVHVDDGVTPMFLTCRASGDPDCAPCRGQGVSLMYPTPQRPLPDHVREAVAWEWYKPSLKWARRKGAEMLDHVQRGGLTLRPLTDAGREALAEDIAT